MQSTQTVYSAESGVDVVVASTSAQLKIWEAVAAGKKMTVQTVHFHSAENLGTALESISFAAEMKDKDDRKVSSFVIVRGGIAYTAEPGIDMVKIIACVPFQNWLVSLDRERFVVKSVHFQSVDMFGPKVGFIKFKADVVDKNGKFIPGIVFMRGGSVGILPILSCADKEYAILTVQPRIPTGSFVFEELPAGMLDGSDNFAGVAAAEIEQELGMKIKKSDLTDMSAAAGHAKGFYMSPGGTDETLRLFSFRKEVTEAELADINGRCTGVLEEGEQITLKVVPLDYLLSVPDGKTIVAYALYQESQRLATTKCNAID